MGNEDSESKNKENSTTQVEVNISFMFFRISLRFAQMDRLAFLKDVNEGINDPPTQCPATGHGCDVPFPGDRCTS